MCKSWCEAITAVVIFVVAMWPALFGAMVSKWIIVIAAVGLFVHSMLCKNCFCCGECRVDNKNMSRHTYANTRKKKRR